MNPLGSIFAINPSVRITAVFLFTLMLLLLSTGPVRAMDSADILPPKINSPQIRMGVVSGIGQKYTSSGDLVTLSDYNSIEFDSRTLVKIEPQVQQLVNVLNQYGHQELGSALHLGVLHLETQPEVNYVAPLHAYGINDRLTVAVGVPIVKYNNRITLSQTGSNLNDIRTQAGGVQELDAAFDRLDVSLVQTVQEELAKKGYKPLQSRSESIVGDVQLAALYLLKKTERHAFTLKSILSLPTGPGDDPDDLADLGIFGQTAVDETLVYNFKPHHRWMFAAKAGYRYMLDDKAVKRVPKDESDSLPSADSKENVNRKTGDTTQFNASANFAFLKNWSAAAGYEIAFKQADRYSGGEGRRYDLLAKDTNSEAHRTRLGVSYDTTTAYFRKEALIPSVISYEFVDTIRGINVERQTIHELWITLFF